MIKNTENIDATDQAILNALLKNCRRGIVDIAKEVKISKETAGYRIKRLEKKGIIRAYKALIDYRGLDMQQYELIVRLKKIDNEKSHDFLEFLKNSEIISFGDCIGHFDYSIVLLVSTLEQLEDFIRSIKKIFGDYLDSIDILITFEEGYLFNGKCKKSKLTPLTDSERNLLKLLINNANISLKDLSINLKKSYPSIVKSLKKLEKSGAVKGYYPDIAFRSIGLKEYAVYIKTSNLSEHEESSLLEYFINEPHILWYSKFLGKYDFAVKFVVPSLVVFNKHINDMVSKFKNQISETNTVRYIYNKQ